VNTLSFASHWYHQVANVSEEAARSVEWFELGGSVHNLLFLVAVPFDGPNALGDPSSCGFH
jgi:hypothetical protein